MKMLHWSVLLVALAPGAMWVGAQAQVPQAPAQEPAASEDGVRRSAAPTGRGPGDVTTRPAWWGRGGGGGFRGGGGDESSIRFRRGAFGGDALPPSDMPTAEQWDEVAKYMQVELPNTWRHFQTVSEDKKEEVKKQIFTKFRETQQLRERNETELYELKMKEAKLADDFAGLARDHRRAPLADRSVILVKLRAKARDIAENQFAQREIRIKRLEDQLAAEKERLARARSIVDRTVDNRMNDLISRVRKDDDLPGRTEPKGPAVEASPEPRAPRRT
jgi:hypothetical protein